MNAEIKAAASFAEKLGTDVDSDFRRHHRQRRAPKRIDDNPDTTANLDMESFYRKEFKAVLDTQISTFTDVLENCVATIKPLFQAIHSLEKNHHHFKPMKLSQIYTPRKADLTPMHLCQKWKPLCCTWKSLRQMSKIFLVPLRKLRKWNRCSHWPTEFIALY